jgi:regulator of ribonuclease activity A
MSLATADLCDAYGGDAHQVELQVCEPIFLDYGGRRAFRGPVRTLKCFEDNALVRQMLGQPGEGAVLVVDAGGSRRCAMLGDQLAAMAVTNGWAGVVMYGLIRDSEAIGAMALGVKALGTIPVKSIKRGEGQMDVPVRFGGVTFAPGQWLYADADGILLADRELTG